MFTSFFGTTMIFSTVFPVRYGRTFSQFNAAFSISSRVASIRVGRGVELVRYGLALYAP